MDVKNSLKIGCLWALAGLTVAVIALPGCPFFFPGAVVTGGGGGGGGGGLVVVNPPPSPDPIMEDANLGPAEHFGPCPTEGPVVAHFSATIDLASMLASQNRGDITHAQLIYAETGLRTGWVPQNPTRRITVTPWLPGRWELQTRSIDDDEDEPPLGCSLAVSSDQDLQVVAVGLENVGDVWVRGLKADWPGTFCDAPADEEAWDIWTCADPILDSGGTDGADWNDDGHTRGGSDPSTFSVQGGSGGEIVVNDLEDGLYRFAVRPAPVDFDEPSSFMVNVSAEGSLLSSMRIEVPAGGIVEWYELIDLDVDHESTCLRELLDEHLEETSLCRAQQPELPPSLAACTRHSDCGGESLCDATNHCSPPGATCRSAFGCEPGQVCLNPQAYGGDADDDGRCFWPACNTSASCADGATCDGLTARCRPGPAICDVDPGEPDDTLETARLGELGELEGVLCRGDVDVVRLRSIPGQTSGYAEVTIVEGEAHRLRVRALHDAQRRGPDRWLTSNEPIYVFMEAYDGHLTLELEGDDPGEESWQYVVRWVDNW